MNTFGKSGIIKHCVALFQKEEEEKLYRIYIAECLRNVSENTAKITTMQMREGMPYITAKLSDLLGYTKQEKKSTKTAEEVIEDFKFRLNGEKNESF